MLRPRLVGSALFLTLIYSTGLHLAWGPESTIRPSFFNSEPRTRTLGYFPDSGSLHDRPLHAIQDDGWKLAGFAKDQTEYLIQSQALSEGRPPYRYRFLPTIIVGGLARLTGTTV